MRPIGYSTGALALGDFRRALALLAQHPTISIVELSALRVHELEPLVMAAETLDVRQFRYISVHAPSKIPPDSEKHVVLLLERLAQRGWPIIVHPDAVHDWSVWRGLGDLLCIENMDKRKPIGRSRSELAACFDHVPKASLCVDLGHARQVDPSMTEAYLILRDFGNRLKQIHLSEVATDSTHERISYTASLGFREVASMIPVRVPIVLETPVSEGDLELELRRAQDALPEGALRQSAAV